MRKNESTTSKKTNQSKKEEYQIAIFKGGFRCSGSVVMVNGTKERIQVTARTEEEALKKWKLKIDARNEVIMYGERKKAGDISVYDACKDLIDEWASGIPRELVKEDKVLSDSSIARLRNVLDYQIKPTSIAKILVKDLQPIDCDQWHSEVNRLKSPKGVLLSASTKQRAFALIDDMLEQYRRGDNPMKRGTKHGWHQKANTKTKNNVLQPNEVIKVEEYCYSKKQHPKTLMDRTYADVTLVLIYCYMRPGEVYGLQKRDWRPMDQKLKIQRTGDYKDGRTKTKDSLRTFYVPRQAADILNKRCEDIKNNDKIFPALNGGLIDDGVYRKWLLKMLDSLGIVKESFSPHKLRGTGISYAIYLGMDLDIVSQNAGHSSVATTLNWYKATYDEAKLSAVKAYEIALENRGKSPSAT